MKKKYQHPILFCLTNYVKPILYSLFLILFIPTLHAQECGTDAIHESKMQNDPEYKKQYLKIQNQIYESSLFGNLTENAAYTLPLVFHIIHLGEAKGQGSNISDYKIYKALDWCLEF